jgi:two-component system response regulator AtoC
LKKVAHPPKSHSDSACSVLQITEGWQMPDLLVLCVIPDLTVRNMAQVAVTEDGHHLQSFPTIHELLDSLEKGVAPDLIILSPGAKVDLGLCRRLLRYVPESKLCFLMTLGERHGNPMVNTFERARFLAMPIARRDVEKVLDDVTHSARAAQVFGIDCSARGGSDSFDAKLLDSRPPELVIEDLGESRYFLALSPAMLEIYRQVKLLEDLEVPVLILGESGTGKEVIAHLLHKHSGRSRERFVNVNCAALPMDLLESELFGHVKGAFTGAISDRPGRFEQSSGGTILLDEIGELSACMQAKLLHVLQDGQFTRLGAMYPTKLDLHILAATNIPMEKALASKTFREDLYYRLNTFTINVPPLRERTQEIPLHVNEIIWRMPPTMKPDRFTHFSSELMELLPQYEWPGNLRELRNFVIRTMVMQDESAAIRELESKIDRQIATRKLPPANAVTVKAHTMHSLVQDVTHRAETRMIEEALVASGWNRRNAARTLNISYRSLLYKIQQYQLSPHNQRLQDRPPCHM